MSNILTYIPRDSKGKFSNYRKIAKKIIIKQLFVLGWVLAIFFARQNYVIRCGYNSGIHGYFMSRQECDTAFNNWFNANNITISNEQAILANNAQELK